MITALHLIENFKFGDYKAKLKEKESKENRIEMDNRDEALKSQIAIRCANAAVRLLALRSSPNYNFGDQDEEKETMRREITDTKIELLRERVRSQRIKLCSLMEFALQVVTVLSVSTLLLILAFNSA